YSVQRAWRAIGVGQVDQIFTQIRSRLLDFLLELSEKVDPGMTDDDVKRVGRSPETSSMFDRAIFGDNTTILIEDHNRQNVTNQIIKGDFDSLKSSLTEKNVSTEDIDDLKSALHADEKAIEVKSKNFGPSVRTWLKKMLSKAIDTSWQIEIGIASNF